MTPGMEIQVTAPDRVLLDGQPGRVTFDRAEEGGEFIVGDVVVRFRLYGASGQGFDFAVSRSGMERVRVSYMWREGLSIHDPSTPARGVEIDGGRITDGAVKYGDVSFNSTSIAVKLGSTPLPMDAVSGAVAIALYVMYAERIILFARS